MFADLIVKETSIRAGAVLRGRILNERWLGVGFEEIC
jgi:hypothetical protein